MMKQRLLSVAFDAAQSAVAVRVEIDLAGVGSDACVSQVRFESDQLWLLILVRGVELSREDARAAGGVDR